MCSLKRKEIANGVFFSSVFDDRFKTMRISVSINVPLKKETASTNALLCSLLVRSCEKYPDFTQLSKYLGKLYGAELSCNLSKNGDNQMLYLTVAGIDDRYAFDKESVSQELARLLCCVLFEPNIKDGSFVNDDIEQERRQLLEYIDSEYNDKRIYSLGQAISIMCADEVFGMKHYGTKEDVQSVTSEMLVNAWRELLQTAQFEIICVGNVDEKAVESIFTEKFSSINRQPVSTETKIVRAVDKVKEQTEKMDVAQSKLILGFRTDSAGNDDDVFASKLMSVILGGGATSKLFNNVREKLSLCYYCAARIYRSKGIMLIESGVETQNVQKAKEAILNEIEEIKKGNITDFEMDSAKLLINNSFNSSNDTVTGIEKWYQGQILSGDMMTPEQACDKFNAITKEEVVKAANKLKLDTVYVLASNE
ncbi:MAG: EF-P 5-aminopentanol modification-associated protein YfmF [Acutalibacteraceae bacterium]